MAQLTPVQRRVLVLIDQHSAVQRHIQDWLSYMVQVMLADTSTTDLRSKRERKALASELAKAMHRAERMSELAATRYFTMLDRVNERELAMATPGRLRAPRRPAPQPRIPVARKEIAPVRDDVFTRLEKFVDQLEAKQRQRTVEEEARRAADEMRKLQQELDKQNERRLRAAERKAMADQQGAVDQAPKRRRNGKLTGYRRVVHPETAKTGTCGLCLVASVRMYSRPDLKPIHERCNCTVTKAFSNNDIGDSLNNLGLGDVYDSAEGMTNLELKRSRFKAGEDGTLTHTHTTPITDIGRESEQYKKVRRNYRARANYLRRTSSRRRTR